jgi:ribose 5-phosphate isomerase RpiB
MRIAIASDHAAVALKADLVQWLADQGHSVEDLGPHDTTSVDYPDYGYKLIGPDMAKAILTAFLATDFGGDRHARRVGKLSNPPISAPA